jgi:hypothetical protein
MVTQRSWHSWRRVSPWAVEGVRLHRRTDLGLGAAALTGCSGAASVGGEANLVVGVGEVLDWGKVQLQGLSVAPARFDSVDVDGCSGCCLGEANRWLHGVPSATCCVYSNAEHYEHSDHRQKHMHAATRAQRKRGMRVTKHSAVGSTLLRGPVVRGPEPCESNRDVTLSAPSVLWPTLSLR